MKIVHGEGLFRLMGMLLLDRCSAEIFKLYELYGGLRSKISKNLIKVICMVLYHLGQRKYVSDLAKLTLSQNKISAAL